MAKVHGKEQKSARSYVRLLRRIGLAVRGGLSLIPASLRLSKSRGEKIHHANTYAHAWRKLAGLTKNARNKRGLRATNSSVKYQKARVTYTVEKDTCHAGMIVIPPVSNLLPPAPPGTLVAGRRNGQPTSSVARAPWRSPTSARTVFVIRWASGHSTNKGYAMGLTLLMVKMANLWST